MYQGEELTPIPTKGVGPDTKMSHALCAMSRVSRGPVRTPSVTAHAALVQGARTGSPTASSRRSCHHLVSKNSAR